MLHPLFAASSKGVGVSIKLSKDVPRYSAFAQKLEVFFSGSVPYLQSKSFMHCQNWQQQNIEDNILNSARPHRHRPSYYHQLQQQLREEEG